MLADLDRQIAELEATIAQKERWEMREEKREDLLAEEGTFEAAMGGLEVRRVAVLVGAETERRQLEALLSQKAAFQGAPLSEPSKQHSRPVIGFGKEYAEMYGLGGRFDEEAEAQAHLSRFEKETDTSHGMMHLCPETPPSISILCVDHPSICLLLFCPSVSSMESSLYVLTIALSSYCVVPIAVRAKGTSKWVAEDDGVLNEAELARIERVAEKAKRSKLAFAGFV